MSENLARNIVPLPRPRKASPWQKTRYANLVRYKPTGAYYVRAHVNGRTINESLNTGDVQIALRKRDDRIAEERAKSVSKLDENVTVGDLCEEYMRLVNSDPRLKPRSKEYRQETLEVIDATWPELRKQRVTDLTQEQIEPWAQQLMDRFSATRYNGVMQSLRGILQIAVDRHLLSDNPARTRKRHSRTGIPNAPVKLKAHDMPDREQWAKLLKLLDEHPRRIWSARFVRLLAYTGARIGSLQRLSVRDIDIERNQIAIPPIKYSERPIIVPILSELRPVLEAILREHPRDGTPLIPIKTPKRTLDTVGGLIGLKLTPHTFRHIFTSTMLAQGVPVATVAQWRGDRDGGAMLLRVYSHQLQHHSQALASKITFSGQDQNGPKSADFEI